MTLGAMSRSARSPKISRTSRLRGGTATVELAMILPLMLALIFGILEIGLMVRSSSSLGHVARDVARIASVGAAPSRIASHVHETSAGLIDESLTVNVDHRSWDEESGTWGSWTTLTGDAYGNAAQSGDQIRVQLDYEHLLATGSLLADVFSASEDNTVALDSTVVSVRE